MRSIRKSGSTALTAAIALSLGTVPVALAVPGLLSGGSATTVSPMTALTPGAISAGQVVLTTTANQGTVTGNGKTQAFTGGQQCEVTPLDSVHLLDITGSIGKLPDGSSQTGTPGFRDGDLGVFEPAAPASDPNNASQCFRVDSGSFTDTESLTLALGDDPGFTDVGGPVLAEKVTVDLYAKTQTGTVEVSTLDSAGAVITTTTYDWPKTKPGSRITVVPAQTPGTTFDGIRVTASTGSFSLRGATFDLVSLADARFCNPGNPAGGESTYAEGTTSVNYLGNADSSNSCFAVELTSGDRSYQWLKPLTVSPDAQFTFTQVWSLPTPATPDYSLPKAYINFELPGGSPDREMLFCPDWLYDSSGSLALVTDGATLDRLKSQDMEPDAAGVAGSVGTQFACIDKKSRTTAITGGTDGLKVTDKIFLIGDAKFSM